MTAAVEEDKTWVGFGGKTWQVHKFGGTSVANADCYRIVARIVEDQLGTYQDGLGGSSGFHPVHLSLVVSAMGGSRRQQIFC